MNPAVSIAGVGDADACLCFEVAGRRFAVDVAAVREVLAAIDVTPVPHAPEFALGVGAVRGRIVPVVDPGLLLGLGPAAPAGAGAVVLVNGVPVAGRSEHVVVACVVGAIAGLRPRAAVAADGVRWLEVDALLAALATPVGPGADTPPAPTATEPGALVRQPS